MAVACFDSIARIRSSAVSPLVSEGGEEDEEDAEDAGDAESDEDEDDEENLEDEDHNVSE